MLLRGIAFTAPATKIGYTFRSLTSNFHKASIRGIHPRHQSEASIRVFKLSPTETQVPYVKRFTTFDPEQARLVRDDEVAGSLPSRSAAP